MLSLSLLLPAHPKTELLIPDLIHLGFSDQLRRLDREKGSVRRLSDPDFALHVPVFLAVADRKVVSAIVGEPLDLALCILMACKTSNHRDLPVFHDQFFRSKFP